MPTVRIDDEVLEGLKKLAEPFVDTPSSVIRRLLEEKGILSKPKAQAIASTPAGLTPQAVYESYLLSTLARDFDCRAHQKEVTQAVIERMQADGLLGAADLELVATGETKAENTISWGRNALKGRGLISQHAPRGIWELTAEGREAAKQVVLARRRGSGAR